MSSLYKSQNIQPHFRRKPRYRLNPSGKDDEATWIQDSIFLLLERENPMRTNISFFSLLAFLLTASGAHGYQLKKSKNGSFVRWELSNITYSFHHSMQKTEEGRRKIQAVRKSFQSWQDALGHRLKFKNSSLQSNASLGYNPKLGKRNENTIIWEDKKWSHHPDTMAITLVSYKLNSGVIVDADIAFNAVHYNWYVQKYAAQQSKRGEAMHEHMRKKPWIEVENTAVHEIGHLLGLGHSHHSEATMYPSQSAKELSKRILHTDDIDGIMALYGARVSNPVPSLQNGQKPTTNSPPPSHMQMGCSTASASISSESWVWWVGMSVLLLFGFRRKKIKAIASILPGLLLVMSWSVEPVHATSIRPMKLEMIQTHARHIVMGTIEKQTAVWSQSKIYTISTIRVKECIKGICKQKTMHIQQLGGQLNGIGMFVHGSTLLKPASQVLLFLYPQHSRWVQQGKIRPLHRIVGFTQGLFRFVEKEKNRIVLRHKTVQLRPRLHEHHKASIHQKHLKFMHKHYTTRIVESNAVQLIQKIKHLVHVEKLKKHSVKTIQPTRTQSIQKKALTP